MALGTARPPVIFQAVREDIALLSQKSRACCGRPNLQTTSRASTWHPRAVDWDLPPPPHLDHISTFHNKRWKVIAMAMMTMPPVVSTATPWVPFRGKMALGTAVLWPRAVGRCMLKRCASHSTSCHHNGGDSCDETMWACHYLKEDLGDSTSGPSRGSWLACRNDSFDRAWVDSLKHWKDAPGVMKLKAKDTSDSSTGNTLVASAPGFCKSEDWKQQNAIVIEQLVQTWIYV